VRAQNKPYKSRDGTSYSHSFFFSSSEINLSVVRIEEEHAEVIES